MNTQKLSVILICKNEEKNIFRCLNALRFADEIVLVDSGSADRTLKIASQFTNVKIFESAWLGYSKTKELAISKTEFDWILWIDADEVVSDSLIYEWKKFSNSQNQNSIGAISLARKTFFLGHLVKHSGWNPETLVRFFHKDRANLDGKLVHEGIQIKLGYSLYNFSSCLYHYSYDSLSKYFHKMIHYGHLGALELIQKNRKLSSSKIILSPLWAFIKAYIINRGFLDGLIGIIICLGAAFANYTKYSYYFFLKEYGYLETPDKQN